MDAVSHRCARSNAYTHYVIRGLLLSFGVLACARAAEPLDIDEAIERARAEAPQVAAASANVESAQALALSAGRLPDPEAIVAIDNLPVNGADAYSLGDDFMTMRKAGFMQAVPNGAKRRLEGEVAAREVDLATARLLASRFEAGRAAADAWIAGATASESLDRLRTLRKNLEAQTVAARATLASGRGSLADALTSETELALLDGRIAMYEQELLVRRAELARWLGDVGERDFAALPVERELAGTTAALIENVAQHPPLAPIGAGVEVARTEVALARAAKRPDWSAEMTFAKRGPDYSDMVSLEFRIALPLFARNRQDPVIASKLARLRAEEAEQQSEIRMHRAEIEAMVATWRGGRERLRLFSTQLLPLARDRSNAVLSSFRSGRSELRAVSEALRDEIDVQLQFVELEAEVVRAWVYLHLLHTGASS